MAMIDPVYRNLIQFVPERPSNSEKFMVKEISASLSGQDVRNFYESVVSASSSSVSTQPVSNTQDDCRHGKLPAKSNACKQVKKGKKSKSAVNVKVKSLSENEAEAEAVSACGLHTNLLKGSISARTATSTLQSQPLTNSDRRHFRFLHAAQLGDCSKVCELLDQGVFLNYKDFYGWTALMCAAKEGHDRMVRCLLDRGADSALVNNDGHSASCLASLAGHLDLAYSISSYSLTTCIPETSRSEEANRLGSFYCTICKEHFSKSEKNAHFTSTVHLFNSGRKHQHPAYLLPETNRGFQMLLRNGWQVNEGLGPDGKGIKYPVKTVLKRDREGLGKESEGKKAKITHFNPRDEAAIDNVKFHMRNVSARKSAQYALRSKEKRQRRKDINFRLEFRDL
ncbi:hypothetical protein RRG08_022027 [Elysia crispata]|uniref:G-patch domain-containing protein n=1 Tax=Elysia crispata TaxID=231223 RepID=A0AAE0YXE9_9GAST|nr:hypothetical protein RRG08_022027 [Elysia crispata]